MRIQHVLHKYRHKCLFLHSHNDIYVFMQVYIYYLCLYICIGIHKCITLIFCNHYFDECLLKIYLFPEIGPYILYREFCWSLTKVLGRQLLILSSLVSWRNGHGEMRNLRTKHKVGQSRGEVWALLVWLLAMLSQGKQSEHRGISIIAAFSRQSSDLPWELESPMSRNHLTTAVLLLLVGTCEWYCDCPQRDVFYL